MSTRTTRASQQEEFLKELKPPGSRLILSIDGGGTRGYMVLRCLVALESLTGKSCHEIFDFYVGTSAGALIAAGLAAGKSAGEIFECYQEGIPRVFEEAKPGYILRTLIGTLIGFVFSVLAKGSLKEFKERARLLAAHGLKYMYTNAALKSVAQEIVADKNVRLTELYEQSKKDGDGEHTKRLMIVTKDVVANEPLFLINAGPGAEILEKQEEGTGKVWTLADAAVASAVAPIFLQPFERYVDGSVGIYANPCYAATVEATEYFTGLVKSMYVPRDDDLAYFHDNIIHLSFGTGRSRLVSRTKDGMQEMNFLEWMLYTISEGMDDAADEQVRLTERRFAAGNNWYSLQSPNLEALKDMLEKKHGEKPTEVSHLCVDFRRYQLVFDYRFLNEELGIGLSEEDGTRLDRMMVDAHSQKDLELLETIGNAWAQAIGEGFLCPHSPYAECQGMEPYEPPGSPERYVHYLADQGQLHEARPLKHHSLAMQRNAGSKPSVLCRGQIESVSGETSQR
jgi:predicted acylesterase/phospholipase RssA